MLPQLERIPPRFTAPRSGRLKFSLTPNVTINPETVSSTAVTTKVAR